MPSKPETVQRFRNAWLRVRVMKKDDFLSFVSSTFFFTSLDQSLAVAFAVDGFSKMEQLVMKVLSS